MTQLRHKHYQCIRAFADGWKIEWSIIGGTVWANCNDFPAFDERRNYRIVPDDEGWLPWYATEDSACPVDGDAMVEVVLANSVVSKISAKNVVWNSFCGDGTIVRYRIVKKHKASPPKPTLVKTIKVFSDGSTEEESK